MRRETPHRGTCHPVSFPGDPGKTSESRRTVNPRLFQEQVREGVTASRALGYRQVLELLDGQVDEAEAKAASTLSDPQAVPGRRTWTVPNR